MKKYKTINGVRCVTESYGFEYTREARNKPVYYVGPKRLHQAYIVINGKERTVTACYCDTLHTVIPNSVIDIREIWLRIRADVTRKELDNAVFLTKERLRKLIDSYVDYDAVGDWDLRLVFDVIKALKVHGLQVYGHLSLTPNATSSSYEKHKTFSTLAEAVLTYEEQIGRQLMPFDSISLAVVEEKGGRYYAIGEPGIFTNCMAENLRDLGWMDEYVEHIGGNNA